MVCLLGSPEKAGSVGSGPGPPGSALATHTQSRQSWANMGKCGVWAILGKFGHVNENSLTSVAQQPIHLFIELQDKERYIQLQEKIMMMSQQQSGTAKALTSATKNIFWIWLIAIEEKFV